MFRRNLLPPGHDKEIADEIRSAVDSLNAAYKKASVAGLSVTILQDRGLQDPHGIELPLRVKSIARSSPL